jgi:NAD/NADP transhydrogenase beta subunit
MEIVADILGPLNMKAGNLAIEAGLLLAAFLFLTGLAVFIKSSRAAFGSTRMAAGIMLGYTIFFFVQRDKTGNSFGAINILLPLLLAITGSISGVFLMKYFSRPTFPKNLHRFNSMAGAIGLLICLTGFARTHHNAVLISAFGVAFGLLALAGSWVILGKKSGRWAQIKLLQGKAAPCFLLFLSSMSLSLAGYIVVSTPMILAAVTIAAMALSLFLGISVESGSRWPDYLRKRITA